MRSTFSPPLVVKRSKIQGSGAFATRRIAKGERIIEYVGKRISTAEANEGGETSALGAKHHTFLFQVSSRTTIDAGTDGNDARFINHSCAPNAYSENIRGRIFIIAKRPIEAGEEISYDYCYVVGEGTLEELRRDYPCRCGTPKCRKTLARLPEKKKPAAKHATKKVK